MPTNRTRQRRLRLAVQTPAWAERLLEGERPERDTPEDIEFAGWAFFGDQVPGLPLADSPEGFRLWFRATSDADE
jgi:hypothetical protein